tara:strand:+ start:58 stop:180 length:123 start_codon:yes stop_codon:yes gene_type:complete
MRKLSEACRKCGAVSGEYCKHCSGKKKKKEDEIINKDTDA